MPTARRIGGRLDRLLADRDGADRDDHPFPGEFAHEHIEALALRSEQIAGGNADIVEEEFGRVIALHSQLVEIAPALETGSVALDEAQADAACSGRWIGLRQDDHDVGAFSVAAKGLGAVYDIIVDGAAGAPSYGC